MTGHFVTALIGQPYGLKGFVKVRPLSGETGHLENLKSVILRQGTKDRVLDIEETAYSSSVLVMKFRGYDSPEAAKALAGASLVVSREDAAPLDEDDYYIEDLKSLALVFGDFDGEVLGEIYDVVEGGGGDLVEVKLPSGEHRLVPFRKEFFGPIDTARGQAVLLHKWILE